MRYTFLVLLLLLSFSLTAENYTIKGQFTDHTSKSVYLSEIVGDKVQLLDSTRANSQGHFEFMFSDQFPVGMYRFHTKAGAYLDLIFNNENISFTTTAKATIEKLNVLESFENKIYYDYLAKRNYDQYRLEILQPAVAYYPYTDAFYPDLKNEFEEIQSNLDQYIHSLITNYPESFVAKILRLDRKPMIDGSMSPAAQKSYLKQHYFDHKEFNDPALLRSNFVGGAILSYLSLYQDNKLGKDDLEREFMTAVDSIMTHAKQNVRMNEYVSEYLINGFEQFGFYKVMTHVAEQMIIDENCENPELEQRVETLRKLVNGAQAPNIESTQLDGSAFDLSELEKEYTLLVFWSTQCPHCAGLLPELHEFYQEYQSKLEVVAISIDKNRSDLVNYLSTVNYQWINICDFKGWDGAAPIDYGIYTTPNMFLLDKDKKIVTHPATIVDVMNAMK